MHIIFMAPHFPANQKEFVRALHSVGARVTGIGDCPAEYLGDDLKSWLSGYEQVSSIGNEEEVFNAVVRIQKRGPWVHKFEATIESHMLVVARVRERTGIPGVSYKSTLLCRDKFIMKQELRKQGIPCAMNCEVNSREDAVNFAKQVGFPIILKPRGAAGAHGTYKVNNIKHLHEILNEIHVEHNCNYTAEQFISGHEGFYDTLTVNGEIVFDAISHYYPNVLEGMRNRWISPQILVTNRMDSPGYKELKVFGHKVNKALDLQTAPTHMEWFYGAGGLNFSEIGARPPGCLQWSLYNHANDMDLYVEWAKAIVYGEVNPKPSRNFSAGLIALRPNKDGQIAGYTGRDEIYRKYGPAIVHGHFPPEGSRTAPVEAGFLGNSWMWIKHPDYDVCREIMTDIGNTIKVIAH